MKKEITLLVLLCMAFAVAAAIPPAMPGEGSTVNAVFNYANSSPVAGEIVLVSCGGEETAVITNAGGEAVIYSLPCAGEMSARLDFEGTPYNDYYGQGVVSGTTTLFELSAFGVLEATAISQNNSQVSAVATVDCGEWSAGLETLEASPASLVVPAGHCTVSVDEGAYEALEPVEVRAGEKTSVVLELEEARFGETLEEKVIKYGSMLAVFAVFAGVLVLLYKYIGKSEEPEKKTKKKKRKKKRRKSKAAAFCLVVLLALAGAAGAASVSNEDNISDHVYDLMDSQGNIPDASSITVSGAGNSVHGCRGTNIIEFGEDNKTWASVGSVASVSPEEFTLELNEPGAHRFYRVRNSECWLDWTKLEIREKPDVRVYSIQAHASDGSGSLKTGVPVLLEAEIRNLGGSMEAGPGDEMMIAFYEEGGGLGKHRVGEASLNSSSQVWEEKGKENATVLWVPENVGTRTLSVSIESFPGIENASETWKLSSSRGVYVEPGPSENTGTRLDIRLEPSEAEAGTGEKIVAYARYYEADTLQPVIGADCILSINGTELVMSEWDTEYKQEASTGLFSVGAYPVKARCSKSGYSEAESGQVPLPVVTGGGKEVQLNRVDGEVFGQLIQGRSGLGPMVKLHIRVERRGLETVLFQEESVRINNYDAVEVKSDAQESEDGYLLGANSSYVEWVFDMNSIPGDELNIMFYADLEGANSTYLNVLLNPVGAECTRKHAEVSISPSNQEGEVGTTRYYQLVIENNDARDCGPTVFSVKRNSGRTGWKFEASSENVYVAPGGENITFIKVTPSLSELPGTYEFSYHVEGPSTHSSEGFAEMAAAKAEYTVTSRQQFTSITGGPVGAPGFSEGEEVDIGFEVHYENLNGTGLGQCELSSTLIGAQTLQMNFDGEKHYLTVHAGKKARGGYEYVINCFEPGYQTKTLEGVVTISPRSSDMKAPVVWLEPLVQWGRSANNASYTIKVRSEDQCGGTVPLVLTTDNRGARIWKQYLSVECGGTGYGQASFAPAGNGVEWFKVTAAHEGDAGANSSETAVYYTASPGKAVEVMSCTGFDALESQANYDECSDPCWNYNKHHTYSVGGLREYSVSAFIERGGSECTSPVKLETSNDGVSFKPVKSVTLNGSETVLAAEGLNAKYVRVTDEECFVKRSTLFLEEEPWDYPDLLASSADYPATITSLDTAIVKANIENNGGTTYEEYSVSLEYEKDGSWVLADQATVFSHASGASKQAELYFKPPAAGAYRLRVKVDANEDVLEASEKNNELETGLVIAYQKTRDCLDITAGLGEGWNLVPFLSGVEKASTCNVQEAYALSNGKTLNLTEELSSSAFEQEHGTTASPIDYEAYGAAWVLVKKECSISYSLPWEQAPSSQNLKNRGNIRETPLQQGWNAVTVMPWMEGNTYAHALSNCEVGWANYWNSEEQAWESLDTESKVTEEDVGRVIVVKTIQECALS